MRPALANEFLPRFDHFPGIRLHLGQAETPASGRFFGPSGTRNFGTDAQCGQVLVKCRLNGQIQTDHQHCRPRDEQQGLPDALGVVSCNGTDDA